jgi:hypothetical protein
MIYFCQTMRVYICSLLEKNLQCNAVVESESDIKPAKAPLFQDSEGNSQVSGMAGLSIKH